MNIFLQLQESCNYIKRDYQEWPLRFCLEIAGWLGSLGCAIGMTVYIHNPPLLPLYSVWVASTVIYTWAAWTRGSFGMMANYFLLFCIDSIGLLRLILY